MKAVDNHTDTRILSEAFAAWDANDAIDSDDRDRAVNALRSAIASLPCVRSVHVEGESLGSTYLEVVADWGVAGEEPSVTVRISNHRRTMSSESTPVADFRLTATESQIAAGLRAVGAAILEEIEFAKS